MSLKEAILQARAQLCEAELELFTCDDGKRRAAIRRDIADARAMILRAEYWLASSNTGGKHALEDQSRDG